MKQKNYKRLLMAGCASLLIVAQLTGCTQGATKTDSKVEVEPMEAEVSQAVSLDAIGGKDVMPLAGYYGPYVNTEAEDGQVLPDYNSEEIWSAIAECGINLMIYSPMDYRQYKEQVVKSLDYGEKYNVGVVVTDGKLWEMRSNGTATKEGVAETISEYMNHPAFAGIYLVDEPCTDNFHPGGLNPLEEFETIGSIINQELGIFAYQQAYPSTGGDKEHNAFEQYIRDYCEVLKPTYLMYDRYPFDATNTGKIANHFFDLAVVRQVAKENNIPFWAAIGAGSQWNEGNNIGTLASVTEYYPDEGQFDWHVNTNLAFGMQGMYFFPLIQPYHFANVGDNKFNYGLNGVLNVMGTKNEWWYYIKDITEHIRAIDEVLMNSVNKGVIVSGKEATLDTALAKDYDAIIAGTSWRELKDISGDAMVGCFNYQGKTALYAVNYSMEYAQKIDLTFQGKQNVTVIQNGETKRMQGEGITLDMLAGEGVLLVFE